jgi:hypothetical protein
MAPKPAFPTRGQKAPNFWDDDLKGYVDLTRVITLNGDTQHITVTSDTLIVGTLTADATITLAFSDASISVFAIIDPDGFELTWGDQLVTGTGRVAMSCIYDGALAHYMTSGATVTSVVPPLADVDPPTDPSGLSTSGITSTKITLEWTKSESGLGVDHYNLSTNGGTTTVAEFAHYYTPGDTTADYEFVGLTPETDYVLAVQAVDAQGQTSAWVTIAASTIAGPVHTPPGAPTSLIVTGKTSTTVSLDWVAATPGSDPIVAYRVSKDNGVSWVTEAVDDAVTEYIVTGLTEGVSYTFVVQAGDEVGWGPSSNAVTETPEGFTDESVFSWNFDEGEGGTAAASAGPAGSDMDSTVGFGYTWLDGKHGYGLASKMSAVPTTPVDTSTWDGLTVMCWAQMKTPASGGKTGCLVVGSALALARTDGVRLPAVPIFRLDRYKSGTGSTSADEYDRVIGRITLDGSSAHPYILSHNLTADVGLRAFNGTEYPLDHIAMTWDKATGDFKIIFNGVEAASMTANGVLKNFRVPPYEATLAVISLIDESEGQIAVPNFDAGLRDDLRIIDRALSAAEIAVYMEEPVV